jgi:hypothetical protein
MDSSSLISRLKSSDSSVMCEALLSLSERKRRQTPLSEDIAAVVIELTRYRLNADVDEEEQHSNEMTRHEAISVLGIYYKVESALETLASILLERRDTNFVLETAVSGISAIGRHASSRAKAQHVLAQVALDEKFDSTIRQHAYTELLHLNHKLTGREYSNLLSGKTSSSFDIPWLQSLVRKD